MMCRPTSLEGESVYSNCSRSAVPATLEGGVKSQIQRVRRIESLKYGR